MGVNLNDYKIIYTFPVMWKGWECDSEAHIAIDKQGKRVLLYGNHTSFYEEDVDVLLDKIEEYNEALGMTKEAIRLLSGMPTKGA